MIYSLELNRQVTSSVAIPEKQAEFQDHMNDCIRMMIEYGKYIYVGY